MQRGLLAIGTGGPRQNDSQSFLEMGTDLTPKSGTFGENHVAGKQQVLTFFAAPKPGGFAPSDVAGRARLRVQGHGELFQEQMRKQ